MSRVPMTIVICSIAIAILIQAGCQQIVGAIEYPEYARAREARRHLPPPAPIIDPTTQP